MERGLVRDDCRDFAFATLSQWPNGTRFADTRQQGPIGNRQQRAGCDVLPIYQNTAALPARYLTEKTELTLSY